VQDRVEHRVRDLVGDLVGVPLGDRLRGEEVARRGRAAAAGDASSVGRMVVDIAVD
jgi:hypothetical protein